MASNDSRISRSGTVFGVFFYDFWRFLEPKIGPGGAKKAPRRHQEGFEEVQRSIKARKPAICHLSCKNQYKCALSGVEGGRFLASWALFEATKGTQNTHKGCPKWEPNLNIKCVKTGLRIWPVYPFGGGPREAQNTTMPQESWR